MAMNDYGQQNESLDLLTINLSEELGGEQLIIKHRTLNEKQHLVVTLGNGPKNPHAEAKKDTNQQASGIKDQFAKKLSEGIKHLVPTKNQEASMQAEQSAQTAERIKLRFFKLTEMELKKGFVGKYDVE